MTTLIQLEYIVAVDTYRHFATAADKCFVTQPTLSMQIKKLEDQLGLVIFDRTRQPVVPTMLGEKVIEQARTVLLENSRIHQIIKEEKEDISGEIRIGIIPTISPYLLPLFTGKLKAKFPKVKIKVEELVTERIEYQLKKDLLDVGILVTPLHNPGIIEHPLYYEEMMVYSNLKHQFAVQPIIDIKDIATPEIWLLSDGHCFRHQVINLCDIQNFESDALPFEFEGGNLDTLMRIIDREGGYTLIPELSGLEFQGERAKQVRKFDDITPLREVALVYTRKFAKTKLIEGLAQTIQESIPEHMLDKNRGTIVEWK
ncbi:MAG: LysR substrate-binding domain-containing protein [Bacteroidales bacterium]|jgi:LysR family hydrogen peroxide-inducible transcriptional activator|nr:LysR substrate-binding domain-containing protein [Bacteroidales bacterium]